MICEDDFHNRNIFVMINEVDVSTVCKYILIITIIIIITIITDSVLRQDHGLFQSEFSRQCHLVGLLSNSSLFLPPFKQYYFFLKFIQ